MAAETYLLIDPVLIRFWGLEVRWYGIMYLLSFVIAYFVIRSELKRRRGPVPPEAADDLLFHLIIGLLIGARLGYALFYNLDAYLMAPWEILAVWHGGMSFHGGLAGMICSGAWFARKHSCRFLDLADIGALAAPPGLMLGRMGNFINGELFGRATQLPWGIVFPSGGPISRHPSQLYEAFLEGPVLFGFLWWMRTRVKNPGQILGLFLVLYGAFRFIAEFFREPDPQLGFVIGNFTMGQTLCFVMMIIGIGVLAAVTRSNVKSFEDPRPSVHEQSGKS
jgi:phosphatidylglycerol---prolipoprotein diacylglyceryl transferase